MRQQSRPPRQSTPPPTPHPPLNKIVALTAGLVVASSLPLAAQNLNWDLGGDAGYGTSNGNVLIFTQSGVTVTASAWSYTKNTDNTALESAKLGQWSVGLGVVNREESDSSPWHQVDNYLQNDYLLFTFDASVDLTGVKILPSPGPYDQDVSYWVGNISSSNLNGVTYSGLASLGFGAEQIVSGISTSSAKDVLINAPDTGVNAILFGPKRSLATSSGIDAFKVQSITATVIPEPSAVFLSIIGALGLCLKRRR